MIFFIKKELEVIALEDEDEKVSLIKEGYVKAIEALKKNITPLGFSACSIDDNVAHGTDENYYSVWARDGAITVIGSLSLIHDEEIHKCQRQTLETLLEHISRNGQIPSNVRISSKASVCKSEEGNVG